MSRSVSYPTDCEAVCFRSFEHDNEMWDDFVEWVTSSARSRFPSLEPCDRWLGREDHAVLENTHAYVGISEYCGLVAIWLKSKEDVDQPELSKGWAEQVAYSFKLLFDQYRLVGRASNGEAFYELIEEGAEV